MISLRVHSLRLRKQKTNKNTLQMSLEVGFDETFENSSNMLITFDRN